MNGHAALAVFFIAGFGGMAYSKHADTQVVVAKEVTLQECYKAAQANPKLVCTKT